MAHNITHLKEAVAAIVEAKENSIKEFELIQQLNEQGWGLTTSATDSLGLFNTHFLVYHVLYLLQIDYWAEHRFLEISALQIQLHPAQTESDSTSVNPYADDKSLRDYYLDLNNLENATEDSVNDLLESFWKRFVADDDLTKALNIFELELPVTAIEVKRQYRSLAMTHHPDRGGSASTFQTINWAFGVLQRAVN